jgi:hypothetical protein
MVYRVGFDVFVVGENVGLSQRFGRGALDGTESSVPARVAFEYFGAHPGPQPWHAAEAGEVWVITVPDEGDVDAEIVTVATSYGTLTAGSTREWALTDPMIITARRVPTEVAA